MHLEHVNLTVTDVERSAAFYSDLLDLTVRWKGTVGNGVPAAHVGDDTQYLALFQATRTRPVDHDYSAPGVNHFGFIVPDLDAAKARLEELGVTETWLVDEYEPGRRIYFRDPDDYEVELVEYR